MQATRPADTSREVPPFRAAYAPADEAIAAQLLTSASRTAGAEAGIDARATRLVQAIRARATGLGARRACAHRAHDA